MIMTTDHEGQLHYDNETKLLKEDVTHPRLLGLLRLQLLESRISISLLFLVLYLVVSTYL